MINNNYDNLQNFFKKIDPLELNKKIRNFRMLNFQKMSTEQIQQAIFQTLTFENQFIYIPTNARYPKGTKFFRIRELNGSIIPNPNLKIESDFWNPPKEYIKKYGRLNKPNESLLYTSPINPMVALHEVKPKENSFFAVIQYEAKEDIKVNCIGREYNYEEMGIKDNHFKLINNIINDFLRDEFTRDVGEGTEYLYKISEIIAKSYFDLPPRVFQDAWAYNSVQNKEFYNVCFRPEIARELLNLNGAMICKNKDKNKNQLLEVFCITHGFNENGDALFHNLGSEVQKKIFPEIVNY